MKKFIISFLSLSLFAVNVMAQCEVPGTVTATVRLVRKPSNLLKGQFSVAANTKISFAKGNLQYKASPAGWQFAANQYDIIGSANNSISSSNTDWIDLFGFGTSGYDYKYPYMSSTTDSDYPSSDIAGTDYDWGEKNYTEGVEDGYRVLTADEWTYLMSGRTNASNLRGLATVNGVKGLLLLPDNWLNPGVTFTHNASYSDSYTSAQWAQLEASGAVFLPAAGSRSGVETTLTEGVGYYWTGTAGKCLWFSSSGIEVNYTTGVKASTGMSVRLVQTL